MANSQYETPIHMLPDELLNMIFNRINFQGHLRLSGVCKRWLDLVQNDVVFMRTVKFDARYMKSNHQMMRSYKYVYLIYLKDTYKNNVPENLKQLLKDAETVDLDTIVAADLNCIIPLCKSIREIRVAGCCADDDETPLTFNHRLPIKVAVMDPCRKFLDRFSVITNLTHYSLGRIWVPTEDVMAKYEAIVTSLTMRVWQLETLKQFENLHLESVRLWHIDAYASEIWVTVQSFFEKQAPSIKSIYFDFSFDKLMFDAMRLSLRNLEKVKFRYSASQELRLNDLKVLSRLKRLELEVEMLSHSEFYHLDIGELVTLTDLRITGDAPLRICLPDEEFMTAMEKLSVFNFHLDLEAWKQIAQAMPRLKVIKICIRAYEGKRNLTKFDSSRVAAQFNKLKHLESLTESGTRTFLNNNCLSKFCMPVLRNLTVFMTGRTPIINQITLDKLGEHCPKLLRVFGVNDGPSTSFEFKPFFFARRMNKDLKFRRVHRIEKKLEDDNRLRFDCDSLDSCSDDDCWEH